MKRIIRHDVRSPLSLFCLVSLYATVRCSLSSVSQLRSYCSIILWIQSDVSGLWHKGLPITEESPSSSINEGDQIN